MSKRGIHRFIFKRTNDGLRISAQGRSNSGIMYTLGTVECPTNELAKSEHGSAVEFAILDLVGRA